jgi:hypothetical protein
MRFDSFNSSNSLFDVSCCFSNTTSGIGMVSGKAISKKSCSTSTFVGVDRFELEVAGFSSGGKSGSNSTCFGTKSSCL